MSRKRTAAAAALAKSMPDGEEPGFGLNFPRHSAQPDGKNTAWEKGCVPFHLKDGSLSFLPVPEGMPQEEALPREITVEKHGRQQPSFLTGSLETETTDSATANPHVDKDQIIDEFDRNGPSEDALLEALEKAEQLQK